MKQLITETDRTILKECLQSIRVTRGARFPLSLTDPNNEEHSIEKLQRILALWSDTGLELKEDEVENISEKFAAMELEEQNQWLASGEVYIYEEEPTDNMTEDFIEEISKFECLKYGKKYYVIILLEKEWTSDRD